MYLAERVPVDATQIPNGFHDAALIEIHVSLPAGEVRLTFDFWVGDLDAAEHEQREATRLGVLCLHGVTSMQIEPPAPTCRFSTDRGVVVDGDFGAYPREPAPPDDGKVRLWFFVRTWNSKMTFTAEGCDLTWSGSCGSVSSQSSGIRKPPGCCTT
jgi:hypothetical protein